MQVFLVKLGIETEHNRYEILSIHRTYAQAVLRCDAMAHKGTALTEDERWLKVLSLDDRILYTSGSRYLAIDVFGMEE